MSISADQQRREALLARQLGVVPGRGSTTWQGNTNVGRQPAQPGAMNIDRDIWDVGPAAITPGEGSTLRPRPVGNPRHDLTGHALTLHRQATQEIYDSGSSMMSLLGTQHFNRPQPVEAPVVNDNELVTIGHLGKAVGVKINGIWKYETEGLLPPSIRGKNNRRLYTVAYVKGVQQIALDCGLLSTPRKQIRSTDFSERVWALWRELGIDARVAAQ